MYLCVSIMLLLIIAQLMIKKTFARPKLPCPGYIMDIIIKHAYENLVVLPGTCRGMTKPPLVNTGIVSRGAG